MLIRFMRRVAPFLCLVLSLFTGTTIGRSQTSALTPTYVGAGISAAFNIHQLHLPVYRDGELCGVFEGGNSILPNGFLLFERPFGSLSGLWMAPRLHLNSFGADISTTAIDQGNARDPRDSSLVHTERAHHIDASILALGADLFVRYPLSQRLFLFGGPSISYLLRREVVQHEDITAPANAIFLETGSNTRTLYSGQIQNSRSILPAFTLGGSLDIPVSAQVTLAPELSVRAPLASLTTDASWRIWSIALGASIKFNVARESKMVVVGPEPEEGEITAEVHISGVRDSAGIEIEMPNPQLRVEEFVRRESYPMLNYVFFDSGSAVIPSRYHQITRDSEATGFSELGQSGRSTLDIYHEVLNVLGKRLQQKPGASITLTGYNTNIGGETNNMELSRARAQSVKTYLTSVFGVDPKRITVQAANLPRNPSSTDSREGMEENRRVEITSNDPSMLDPLVTEEIDRSMNPPKIRVRTRVNSKFRLTQNLATLRQGDRTLLRFNTSQPVQDWTPTQEELPRTDSSLVATVALKDVTGVETVATDSARVEQLTVRRKREERIRDLIVERYNLITFDFDKSEIDPRSSRIVETVAQGVTPRDAIAIIGYTDMTGDRAHNLKLSEDRAKNVESALRKAIGANGESAKITERGEGPNNLVDNRLPEGRFLSRTVFIRVERPTE